MKKTLLYAITLGLLLINLSFILAADLTPPTLTISEPKDGAIVYADSVLVKGRATDSYGISKVTVNGGTVTITGSGSTYMDFTKTIYLLLGKNGISTIAIDKSGNQANVKRTVTRRIPLWTVDTKLKELTRVTGLHMHTRLCPGSTTQECYDDGVKEEFDYLTYYCNLASKIPREDKTSITKYQDACNKVASHLDMDCDMYYSKYIQGTRYWDCHNKINSIVWGSNSVIGNIVTQWVLATAWEQPATSLAQALVTLFDNLTKVLNSII